MKSNALSPRRFLIALCAATVALTVVSAARCGHAQEKPAGAWAFDPATDLFSDNAVFDLRDLNEKVAGENGFIQRTPSGDFATESGNKPIRFWAVSEYIQDQDDDAALAHKARWLAKRGVNMVRVHTQIAPDGENSRLTDTNEKSVERVWRLVAAMKKEGIYTTISPYWGVHVKAQPAWNITGMTGKELPGVLFYDKTLQQGYKAWLKNLYNRPVPQLGGKTLAAEPAVAIVQLQNEDSLLFWTVDQIKGEALRKLRGVYGGFLQEKYGSLEKANQAWGGETPGVGEFNDNQGDEFSGNRAGLYIAWFLTGQSPQLAPGSYKGRRLADQLAFYTETMRRFNTEMAAYLKNDLGCKQLINAGNWRPADPTLLFDAERYSYTANDVVAVNRYVTGEHVGKDNGWAIRPGDKFTNYSALRDPRGLPINVKQPVGFPFVVPETEWVAPTLYQSEGPFLTAAYQSLTGVDISYFFADGDVAEWQPPFIPLPWNPPTGKWNVATPMQLGQFPAAAVLFRRGYLRRGEPVVHEERSLEDIYQRRSPLIAEEGGYDPNRDAGNLPARSAVKAGVDPLAFLVGPVEVVYDGDPAKSRALNLSAFINTAQKTVRSNTGEIRLNYGTGVCVINAPKAQGATGFLKSAGQIALGDVTIVCGNDYASVSVVALDDQPLRDSKKMLVQIGTVARPTGWQDKPAAWKTDDGKTTVSGREVVETGKNPWQIVGTEVTLTLKNATLTTATLLDANFLPVKAVPIKRAAGTLTVTLPANAMYVTLQ